MTHPTQRQNQDVFVAGGMDLPPHLLGDSDASFDAPTDPIGRRLATLLHMYPGVKSNFRQADLVNMDNPTKQKLLDSLCHVLDIPKVHSAQL